MTDFIHKTIKIGKKDTFKIFTNASFLATKSSKYSQTPFFGHVFHHFGKSEKCGQKSPFCGQKSRICEYFGHFVDKNQAFVDIIFYL
jgi:hypothetical protein